MEIDLTRNGEQARFTIRGEIDETGAEAMKSAFQQLGPGACQEVIFDFDAVTHIGSAGLGKLLLFYKQMATHGGTLKITHTPALIFELFKQLKLTDIITIDTQ